MYYIGLCNTFRINVKICILNICLPLLSTQHAGKLIKSCKQLILDLISQGYKSEYNVFTKQ